MKIPRIIRKTRMIPEIIEICPRCNKEIREKHLGIDKDKHYIHRGCSNPGPLRASIEAEKEAKESLKYFSTINTEFIKLAQKLPNEDIKIGDTVKTSDGTGKVKNFILLGEPVAEIDIDGKLVRHAIEDIIIIS